MENGLTSSDSLTLQPSTTLATITEPEFTCKYTKSMCHSPHINGLKLVHLGSGSLNCSDPVHFRLSYPNLFYLGSSCSMCISQSGGLQRDSLMVSRIHLPALQDSSTSSSHLVPEDNSKKVLGVS